jgi:hypothetical protein
MYCKNKAKRKKTRANAASICLEGITRFCCAILAMFVSRIITLMALFFLRAYLLSLSSSFLIIHSLSSDAHSITRPNAREGKKPE